MFRKILAVRVGATGDMTMITPAICAILDNFRDAKVDFLTSKLGKRTFTNFNERIGNFHILNRKHLLYAIHKKSVVRRLRQEAYDAVFCFETNPSFHALLKELNTKLFTQKVDPERYTPLDCVAEGIAAARGGAAPAFGLDKYPMFLPVYDEARLRLDSHLGRIGISKSQCLAGLHPSFGGADNWIGRLRYGKHASWPGKNWAALARYIADRFPQVSIIINLMPEERAIGERISELSGGAAIVWTPEPDFEMYKAYLQRLNVFVTPDSGPLHMAAAVGGTKIVTMYSRPELNPPMTTPDRYRVIRAQTCRTQGDGLAAITPAEVFDNCAEFLIPLTSESSPNPLK